MKSIMRELLVLAVSSAPSLRNERCGKVTSKSVSVLTVISSDVSEEEQLAASVIATAAELAQSSVRDERLRNWGTKSSVSRIYRRSERSEGGMIVASFGGECRVSERTDVRSLSASPRFSVFGGP